MTNLDKSERTLAQAVSPSSIARTPWVTVSVVMVGTFMAILDSFIVIVAGPAIKADLHTSDGLLQWILAGYQLTYAVVLITGGRLGDLLGRRQMFILGMAVFTVSSVVCALAQDSTMLLVGRLIEGLGAGVMLPQVFAVITLTVPASERHRVFGVLGVVIGMATIGGQLIGGLLIAANIFGSDWRPVFWVNVPIGLVAILLARYVVPESRAEHARTLDLPGAVILSVALFLLTVPLIQGRESGWPWWTWASFAGSALSFGLFAVVERRVESRSRDPLIRISLFRNRSFSVGILLVLAVYAMLTSYYLVLAVSLQDGLGLSALDSGLVYTPAAVMFFVFSMVASRLVPRYGRRVLEVGAIILALGYAATAITLLAGPRLTPGVVIPSLMLQSVGGGLLIAQVLNTVLSRIDPKDAGVASGVLSTAQQAGGALGVAIIGVVFFNTYHPTIHDRVGPAGHAFGMASIFTFATAAIAAVLVYLLPSPRQPPPAA